MFVVPVYFSIQKPNQHAFYCMNTQVSAVSTFPNNLVLGDNLVGRLLKGWTDGFVIRLV